MKKAANNSEYFCKNLVRGVNNLSIRHFNSKVLTP